MSGFLGVPVDAAYHLVFALTHLLTPVAGGLAAAAAIVLFTAAVRLLISPLSFRALRGQAAMARLAPQVQALRARYGRQPERFQRELTALYKREGTEPVLRPAPAARPVAVPERDVPAVPLRHRGRRAESAAVRRPVRRPARRALAVRHRPAQRPRRALPRRLRRPRRPVLAVGPPGEAGGPRRRGAGRGAPRGPRRPGGAGRGGGGKAGQPGARHRPRPPSRPGRSTRQQQGGGRAHPGAAVRDRGHRRVRPAGRRPLPAHHRRLDPRGTPPLPAPHPRPQRAPGPPRRQGLP